MQPTIIGPLVAPGADLEALWVAEGAGSYGAQLARAASATGYQVVEASPMLRRGRGAEGKSDAIDARHIATATLTLTTDQLRHRHREDGTRAAVQVLLTSRDHLTNERTRPVNALTALRRINALGIDARKPLGAAKITEVVRWRTRGEKPSAAVARAEAVRLAKRIHATDTELKKTMLI
ncbi:IS110 family transposase [Nesterenkonia salmonea]|uniref:IS110 family transposase n=1 Tax=Nesterenkonia salmonea TaxID=1804987 RepID=UPI00140DF7F9|nr:transposase [Nesterenkonia salmonea]